MLNQETYKKGEQVMEYKEAEEIMERWIDRCSEDFDALEQAQLLEAYAKIKNG
tara:strand:+ start:185 stop:343 length:159 start_codon:yes stop_codon:yes gene_type:complete